MTSSLRAGCTSARLRLGWALIALAGVWFCGGCAATRVTDPARTATEQMLLSIAAQRAVEQVPARALRDRAVYLDASHFSSIDQLFVLGELRAHLLVNGARLVPRREDAQVVVEVRTGGVGIDRHDYLLGIPAFVIPTGAGGTPAPLLTPELAAVKNIKQHGYASVSLVAYWADSGEVLVSAGPFVGRTERFDWWFFGIGPRTVGDIPTAQRDPD